MYAVIKTGGKQYRVTSGDVIKIEKIAGEEGKEIVFKEVLALDLNATICPKAIIGQIKVLK